MKQLFDDVCFSCSKLVTRSYSTSFSLAVKTLGKSIRNDIYSIYGFVRFADEIVDTFHDYDKASLISDFEKMYYKAYKDGISLNPILNAFQQTVHRYQIDDELIVAFLNSMKADLNKSVYASQEEVDNYIYGSADVVGLMCLKVFVHGDQQKYDQLKYAAAKLGSAFQKVNFLRDLKKDTQELHRTYFPELADMNFSPENKQAIIENIERDFQEGYAGIKKLPNHAKLGVYIAYVYYRNLLRKLAKKSSHEIMDARIRISNLRKVYLFFTSYLSFKLNRI